MNLEKDVSPTGLYNYLPKMSDPRKTRRRRKPTRRTRSRRVLRKSRTFRSKRKGGTDRKNALEDLKSKVSYEMNEKGSGTLADQDLVDQARNLDVEVPNNADFDTLYGALKRALSKK